MAKDGGLDTLLDLDGQIIDQGDGYWVKIEVRKLKGSTDARPHGIRYSLTLHDPDGTRILGYDNAHAVVSNRRGRHSQDHKFDHRHQYGQRDASTYEFANAYQLLKDFFQDVDMILREIKGN